MNTKLLAAPFALAISLSVLNPAAAAESLAIEQMAEIIINLDAKPADTDKQTLEDIVKDSSSTTFEQTLATSLLNIDNKLSPTDKPNVLKVMTSPSASGAERSLAKILLKFNEKASDDSKQALSQLVSEN